MKITNPAGRPVRLEILTPDDDATMTLTIGPRATVDLATYQRALDAFSWASREGAEDDPPTG